MLEYVETRKPLPKRRNHLLFTISLSFAKVWDDALKDFPCIGDQVSANAHSSSVASRGDSTVATPSNLALYRN